METNLTKHYKAFISYSREDEDFGAWLHKELEKYKIPKNLREDYPNLEIIKFKTIGGEI